MKLAIIVVYIVSPENAGLLDLHLAQIEKNTSSPFTIYAGVNRLLPQFRHLLACNERVKICRCPDTDLRSVSEHSFYLEHLTKYAIQDGATHIVTLHLDSFPVRQAWDMELASKLIDSCSFVTLEGINTACLFFHRDFYLKYKPTYLITDDIRSGKEYWQFQKKFDIDPHSGSGFAFRAYQKGLFWHCLKKSIRGKEKMQIFGNMILHLVGIVHVGAVDTHVGKRKWQGMAIERAIGFLKLVIPRKAREYLRNNFLISFFGYVDGPRIDLEKSALQKRKEKLLSDPEGYINSLLNKNIHNN